MEHEDDIIISLNWDQFHKHLGECEGCKNICVHIWNHISKDCLKLKKMTDKCEKCALESWEKST